MRTYDAANPNKAAAPVPAKAAPRKPPNRPGRARPLPGAPDGPMQLTAQQIRLLAMLSCGQTLLQAGKALGLKSAEANELLKTTMRQLGAGSMLKAIETARERRLLPTLGAAGAAGEPVVLSASRYRYLVACALAVRHGWYDEARHLAEVAQQDRSAAALVAITDREHRALLACAHTAVAGLLSNATAFAREAFGIAALEGLS